MLTNIEFSKDDAEQLQKLHSKLRFISEWICQAPIPNHETGEILPNIPAEMWSKFPFSSNWQTEELKLLSLRTFNLAVSCDVSCFSGWENVEFNLRLIRYEEGRSYFGVHLSDTHVVGYLSTEKELQLASQWSMLGQAIPSLQSVKFNDNIEYVKKKEWYKDALSKLETTFSETTISRYGEKEALDVIMMYSKLCLKLALVENDQPKKTCLLANAMSIMLPLVSRSPFICNSFVASSNSYKHLISSDAILL